MRRNSIGEPVAGSAEDADPMPRLVVVCGLPGTGKTTLARALAAELPAVYLRVDVVETPLLRAGVDVGPLGYEVVRGLARSNLELGAQVVVDLVDPLPVTRAMWRDLAGGMGVPLVVLECGLDDDEEHRRRVETRSPDLPDQQLPTWDDVLRREFVPWDAERDGPRTRIDTADRAVALEKALERLRRRGP